eukprot:jgi/Astpho2/216/Aster-02121
MASWSRLYYGDLPYLLAAAVAGNTLQFFALLTMAAGRAKAAIAVINLHRLLRVTEALLPRWVLPVDVVQRHQHELGYVRSLCFRSDMIVHKTIKPWSTFSKAGPSTFQS